MKTYLWLIFFAGIFSGCVSQNKSQSEGKDSLNGSATFAQSVARVEDGSLRAGNALAWLAELDNPYFLIEGGKEEFYLYVELKGMERKMETQRPPLNLSIVLDRSGSMSGDKIKYAKQAMEFVVNQLSEADYVSVVSYGSDVSVVLPSQRVNDKRALLKSIADIGVSGSTNLCGGMLEGVSQAAKTKQEGFVNRVLLISDGLVNMGITQPAQIIGHAKSSFLEKGIAISTFGVGADYNEDLMTDIANYGGANYYFIAKPGDIAGIFNKELNGLMSVVAQNTVLKVQFPKQNFDLEKVYGYPHTVFGDEVLINLNDVFSKEEKAVLLKFRRKQNFKTDQQFACELKYTDAADKDAAIREQKILVLKGIQEREKFLAAENMKVKENIVLFQSTEMFDEALKEADKGNYEKAKQISTSTRKYIEDNKDVSAAPRIQAQTKNVEKYENEVTTMPAKTESEQKMMQKAGKSANYDMIKKKD